MSELERGDRPDLGGIPDELPGRLDQLDRQIAAFMGHYGLILLR